MKYLVSLVVFGFMSLPAFAQDDMSSPRAQEEKDLHADAKWDNSSSIRDRNMRHNREKKKEMEKQRLTDRNNSVNTQPVLP